VARMGRRQPRRVLEQLRSTVLLAGIDGRRRGLAQDSLPTDAFVELELCGWDKSWIRWMGNGWMDAMCYGVV